MSYNYKASIIVVNYNGKKYIDHLFDSLLQLNTPKESFEVIFEDNHSRDDSLKYLKEKYRGCGLNTRIVQSNKNLGFAGGNNLAVSYASGEYIVFLNNDTAVDPEWLNELLKTIESDKNIGMVNSKLLFYYDFIRIDVSSVDGIFVNRNVKINGESYKIKGNFCDHVNFVEAKDRMTCFNTGHFYLPLLQGDTDYKIEIEVEKKIDPYDFFYLDFDPIKAKLGKNIIEIKKEELVHVKETLVQNAGSGLNDNYEGYDIGFCQMDCDKYNHSYEINNGCGASLMIAREDFDAIGGFDEEFFMYYEDTDMSLTLKEKLNKRIVYCPTSLVRHIHAGSSGEWSKFFTYYVYRNRLLLVYKHFGKEKFEEVYKSALKDTISRHNPGVKLRAVRDAKKMVNGAKNLRF